MPLNGAGKAFCGSHRLVEGLIDGGKGFRELGGGLAVAEGVDEALNVA